MESEELQSKLPAAEALIVKRNEMVQKLSLDRLKKKSKKIEKDTKDK